MQEEYIRTDLAMEREKKENILSSEEETAHGCTVKRMVTAGPAGARYVTLVCPPLQKTSAEERREVAEVLAKELSDLARLMTGKEADGDFSVLVAGLGNRSVTPDAVGPLAVQGVEPTRHLKVLERELYDSFACASLSLLTPGVLGQSGMESADLIRIAAAEVKADLVIVIDALAARGRERLATTVQLSDAGLSPGAGIGNTRVAVNRESIGVPVLSLGIPTVIDVATLLWDALPQEARSEEEKEKIRSGGVDFFVSPKDCDTIVKKGAGILSDALNLAFGIGDVSDYR